MRGFILGIGIFVFIGQAAWAALPVDDCEGHGLGGWFSYADAYSSAVPKPFAFSPEGYQSAHCARLDVELKSGVQYPYAGFGTGFTVKNLSEYEGVRFYAKGEGAWSCQVPTSATAVESNHYSCPFSPGKDWTLFELPFSKFTQAWGTPKSWDPTQVTGVGWNAAGYAGAKSFLCVDNIEFYKKGEALQAAPEANPILKEPKVNQQGYLPEDKKYFCLTQRAGGPKQGDPFQVMDEAGKAAFAGKIQADPLEDLKSTGEKVFQVDFTSLTLPGRYTVELAGLKSQPFEIGPGVYQPLFKDALRCFYLIRCGTAIDDSITGLKHPACHMKDAPSHEDPKLLDLTGGWHNADDYGKWVLEEGVSCSWMLWLYEFKEKQMEGLKIGIPESSNPMSDLLNQARWGLEWMLKMQRPDGGVLHKVDAEDHFCVGTPPEKDPYPRFYKKPGAIDAGDFVGTMCLASRAFRTADPAFAKKCLEAAKKAWKWLEKNPDAVEKDTDYLDTDPSGEKLWALGEMAAATGDKDLVQRFQTEVSSGTLKPPTWNEPQFFGSMALYFDSKTPAKLKDVLKQGLVKACDSLVQASQANGYGVVQAPSEYWWESNEILLDKTGQLLFGYQATGDVKYRDTAVRQMNWFLGENSLGFSFVTGHGTRSASHPWHWIHHDYGILMPGWAMGGPNEYPTGADPKLSSLIRLGTPPAKCYVDSNDGGGSWASNEGETSENAALVFCSGYLAAE